MHIHVCFGHIEVCVVLWSIYQYEVYNTPVIQKYINVYDKSQIATCAITNGWTAKFYFWQFVTWQCRIEPNCASLTRSNLDQSQNMSNNICNTCNIRIHQTQLVAKFKILLIMYINTKIQLNISINQVQLIAHQTQSNAPSFHF